MKPILLYSLLLFPLCLSAQNTHLSGFVSNDDGAFIDGVGVTLFDDQGNQVAVATTENGKYTFTNLPAGYNYTLRFDKAGHPLNGLSTYDYVLIARHLLAVQLLEAPFYELAADIDGSGSVSVSDLVYLRQLILGIIRQLPAQRNWLFLAEDQTPADPLNTNTFTFFLNNNLVEKNFTMLKIGDLNKTANYE